MSVTHIDVEQGSEEWLRARLGRPTASRFSTVIAEGRTKGSRSKTRDDYMRKLCGERMTDEQMHTYTNEHFERGKEMEAEARAYYEMVTGQEVALCGMFWNDDLRAGASPDGLVGASGLLEIKSALPHIIIEAIENDCFPSQHRAQCLGQLIVTERTWCDLVMYWPGMPTFIKTINVHDEKEDVAKIKAGLASFNSELDDLERRVRAYGGGK